ncbi:MAG: MATE family efflux transporter, partial [Oscillospiraceae bacterium]
MFTGGIEGAILIIAAQYWGKKDVESIRKIISVGVKFALGFGMLFTFAAFFFPEQIIRIFTPDKAVIADGVVYLKVVAFTYIFFAISQVFIASMRSVQTAKIGLYVSIMALFVNIGLNYLFIFGVKGLIPAMGIRGAAIATLISRILEAAVIVFYVRFVDKKLGLRFRDLLKTDRLMFRDFVRYGMPVLGGQVVWACNMVANTMILGRFNAGVIAAASITGMLHNLIYVWMTGLSNAVGIMTGNSVGRGEIKELKQNAKTVQMIFVMVGIVSGIAVYLLRDPFISLYNVSPEAMAYSRQFIGVISITIVGTCYQAACLFGLVKSGGDIGFVF